MFDPTHNVFVLFLCPALAALGLSLWLLRPSTARDGGSAGGAGSACDAALRGRWSRWCTLPVAMLGSLVYLFLLAGFSVLAFSPWGPLAEMVRTLLFPAAPLLAVAAVWFMGVQLLAVRRVCLRCVLVHMVGLGLAVLIFCDPRMNPNWGFGRFGVDNLAITIALVAGAAIAMGQLASAAADSQPPAAGRETRIHLWLGVPACAAAIAVMACLRLAAENRPAAPRVPTVLLDVSYDVNDATGSFKVTKMGLHSYVHTSHPPGWAARTAILRLGGDADPQDEAGAGSATAVAGPHYPAGAARAGKLVSSPATRVLAVRIWLEARYVQVPLPGPAASPAARRRCGRIEYRLRDQRALGTAGMNVARVVSVLASGDLTLDSKRLTPIGHVEAVNVPSPAAIFLLPESGADRVWRIVGKPVCLMYDIARARLSEPAAALGYKPKYPVLGNG